MKCLFSGLIAVGLLTPLAGLHAAGQEAADASKVLPAAGEARAATLAVKGLRCEYRTNPLGIDVTKPRLSWTLQSDRRGELQTAYQILVASAPELLAKDQGDIWDSGKVASDRQNQMEYAGKPLESRMRCFWKVRVSNKDGSTIGVLLSRPAQEVRLAH